MKHFVSLHQNKKYKGGDWLLGMTSLEVFNSSFILTNEINKFPFYDINDKYANNISRR